MSWAIALTTGLLVATVPPKPGTDDAVQAPTPNPPVTPSGVEGPTKTSRAASRTQTEVPKPRPARPRHVSRLPNIALDLDADDATAAELRQGLEEGGLSVVDVPQNVQRDSLLWQADYVVTGSFPSHSPEDRSPPEVQLEVRMVRDRDAAFIDRARLTSLGALHYGRLIAKSVTRHWKAKVANGVLFQIVVEGVRYEQLRGLERLFKSTGVVHRARMLRLEQGAAQFDVYVPPDLSPTDLAEALEGWPLGDAVIATRKITDEAVHISLVEEPADP